jgi:archaetidylinositol phosphate synthase
MVLERYRLRVRPYLDRLSRPFLGWSPNTLSALSLGLSFLAGALAALVRFTTVYLFLPVALLVFAGGVFDVLDGEVARRTGRASARGDFLDHVFDRYADLAVVLGLAASGYANPILALLALASLLLTSYMGTQAQAVGGARLYAGLLTRADRLLLLAAAAFLEFDWSLPWPWAPTAPWSRFAAFGVSFTVIDVTLAYFVIAGQITAILRATRTHRSLAPGTPPRTETPAPEPPGTAPPPPAPR